MRMKIGSVVLVLGMSLLGAVSLFAAEKANVIIIYNDDQGYRDLACYGGTDLKTPNVDRLAAEGMRFTDFYMVSSVCSPSRAGLLTGLYPHRAGVPDVLFPVTHKDAKKKRNLGLDPKHFTLAEMFKSVGYRTKAVGKWHLGDLPEYLPTGQGFDSYYGIPFSNDMYPADYTRYADDCLFREGWSEAKIQARFKEAKAKKLKRRGMAKLVPLLRDELCVEFPTDQSTITRRLASNGMEFISESVQEKKPFFLYLANPMPHTPLFASKEFMGKSARGLYGDTIEEIDYNVGRILDHLDALGIRDNTIVFFTSDNGATLKRGDTDGSNLPLFEGKATHFDGGYRVPGIIRWPKRVPAGSICSEMASSIDLMPTFARIVGAEVKSAVSLDGKDISDLIYGKAGAVTPHKNFFFDTYAVRSGDWKYHQERKFVSPKNKGAESGPALYNLKEDIGESKNRVADYPEIGERLRKVLLEHNEYMGAGDSRK